MIFKVTGFMVKSLKLHKFCTKLGKTALICYI